jgi:hypothetical protein
LMKHRSGDGMQRSLGLSEVKPGRHWLTRYDP